MGSRLGALLLVPLIAWCIDPDQDNVCTPDEIEGCYDSAACNYNENATDVGVCEYASDLDACATCSGQTDGTGTIIDNDADDDTVCDSDDNCVNDSNLDQANFDGDDEGDVCDRDDDNDVLADSEMID